LLSKLAYGRVAGQLDGDRAAYRPHAAPYRVRLGGLFRCAQLDMSGSAESPGLIDGLQSSFDQKVTFWSLFGQKSSVTHQTRLVIWALAKIGLFWPWSELRLRGFGSIDSKHDRVAGRINEEGRPRDFGENRENDHFLDLWEKISSLEYF